MRPECDLLMAAVSSVFLGASLGRSRRRPRQMQTGLSRSLHRQVCCVKFIQRKAGLRFPLTVTAATVGRQLTPPLRRHCRTYPALCSRAVQLLLLGAGWQTSRLADEATALGTTGTQSLPRLPVCLGRLIARLIGLGSCVVGLFKFPIPNELLRSGDAYF